MTNHFEVCSVAWSQHTECAHEVGLVSTLGRQSFNRPLSYKKEGMTLNI